MFGRCANGSGFWSRPAPLIAYHARLMQMPDDRYEPISVDEAASRLKVSPSTVRRMIRDGKLQAEREQRPQGEIVRVLWPAANQVSPPVTPPSDPPAIDLSAAVIPLMDRIGEMIEHERQQAARIASLERENGRLESEATHAAEAARIEREGRERAEREIEALRARRWWQLW